MMKSKKARAFFSALVVIVAVHLFGLDEETATKIAEQVMILTMGYMGAQGVADHGKERVKADAAIALDPVEGAK